MITLGAFSAFGGYLISQAYRGTEAALIAPFEYFALILSVFWGYMIWSEFPVPLTWAGIGLILASGLFIAFREAQTGGRPSAKRVGGPR